ncbi:hypothetical protein L1887_24201 [Cichorium endivia]|nr:hypothetical protein L1887_24201 [Cichorium endivia]
MVLRIPRQHRNVHYAQNEKTDNATEKIMLTAAEKSMQTVVFQYTGRRVSKSEPQRILTALANEIAQTGAPSAYGAKAPSFEDIAENRMHLSVNTGRYLYQDNEIPTISKIRPFAQSSTY